MTAFAASPSLHDRPPMFRTIGLLFEFPTLLGGERSLLAAIAARPTGIAARYLAFVPTGGPLDAALAAAGIDATPFETRDAAGVRRPEPEIQADLAAAVARHPFDLVHANSLSAGRLLGRLAPHLPCPTTSHLRDIVKLSSAAVADLNRHRRLVAVSEATRQFHVAQGLDAPRTVTIHNGIALRPPAPKPGPLRRELGLSADTPLIGNIGQICLRKAQDVFLEAMAEVHERRPDAHVVVIGERASVKAESREFEANLRRVADSRLPGRCHFLGYRPDAPALVGELTLLVHTARQEPLGRVLLEAAASGRPVVATDVGGTREILEPGTSALLVPPNDTAATATAVLSLLESPGEAARLAANARTTIATRFSPELSSRRLHDLWEEAIRAGRE